MVIHRPIGRRLSDVYVDQAMRPARSGRPTQRLSDVVYWRTHAVPGELIQERSGGMVLVTRAGTLHPIRLSAPEPLHVETAFTHTERAHHRPGSPCPRCTGGTTTPVLAGSAGALAPAIASRGSSAGNRRTAGGDSPLDPSQGSWTALNVLKHTSPHPTRNARSAPSVCSTAPPPGAVNVECRT